ncbi:hypothetical protein DBR42_13085 [Pelomonas sp. HMWF004]|nr:hypothetical protein DBR42_13085 [Pelomonas sp. HMWF004]
MTDETYENGDPNSTTLPSFQVTADLQGDVQSLAGKTIYVVVEDPHGFVKQASVVQPITQTRNTLFVETKTFGPRKGRYTGNFKVLVCYDAACTSQFGGSPIVVPYDIEVLQGLVLNGNAPISFSARAGETQTVSFPLTMPEGLLLYPVALPPPLGGQPQLSVEQMISPSIAWRVVAGATPSGAIAGSISAGVASDILVARAEVQTPKGKRFRLSAQVQVLYTLLP